MIKEIPVEIIGLIELKRKISDSPEDGKTPLENSRQKAKNYYQTSGMLVFYCDSGLYIDGLQKNYNQQY